MGWFGKLNVWRNKLTSDNNPSNENPSQNMGKSIMENEQILKNMFHNCTDIIFREVTIHGQTKLLLIYAEDMIDTNIITTNVLKPLLYDGLPQGLGTIDSVTQMFEQELLSVLQTKKLSSFGDISEHILKGSVAVLIDGENTALLADVSKFETRAIDEPTNEAVLRGSRESFTEHLRTNTTLLRRIIATPKLKMETFKVGKLTKTDVVVTYIEGIVSMSVLKEVRKRIDRIQIDGILESGYIEEAIEDTHFSPFPQMLTSERPDVVAAGLLEGKVAILTNGTPFALIVPMTFWDGLQAPDDYYERFMFVSLNRWIRYVFAVFSVTFPSVFIALTNFHPEMVPPKLMMSIASLREKAPFPTVIEVFIMEFMFEGLREAGIRLPKQIGPLVSIVGALVIGEAAVRAGIISAPIVIVVSAAGISSFVIPRYRFGFPLRMIRFPLLILSGVLGLFGVAIGMIAIIIHLIHLSPFGVPYLTPLAPLNTRSLMDLLLRWPRRQTKYTEPANEADHP
ncbi:spore germination protein [Paenibacillus sp. GP183]|jgi:spore germination protein|uniref:spore germination protein n=1 Tax=Paenibacillus sp. GP183 TaxID=1882751 RepID=UPI0008965CCA|nr:spore germination protein [Paenibacillus sp. GP183]SEC55166.1 spore germination protein KA [Paenibacillus sp. GP183]